MNDGWHQDQWLAHQENNRRNYRNSESGSYKYPNNENAQIHVHVHVTIEKKKSADQIEADNAQSEREQHARMFPWA